MTVTQSELERMLLDHEEVSRGSRTWCLECSVRYPCPVRRLAETIDHERALLKRWQVSVYGQVSDIRVETDAHLREVGAME